MNRIPALVLVAFLGYVHVAPAQQSTQNSTLIDDEALDAIIAETSGELGLKHFERLLEYSGFAPSLGAEQTANDIAERTRMFGLADVRVETFPSDGKRFFWAFRTEPWWEAQKGDLWVLDRETRRSRQRVASFDVHRVHLGRFSTSAELETELVDVGAGTRPEDYEAKSVAGKIVLASGSAGRVHELAVWEHGAAGVVVYRVADHIERPHLIRAAQIVPFVGPRGEQPGFVFSLCYAAGKALSERLSRGETLRVRAQIEAETKVGHYPQVHATILGTEPSLPEVWIQAHTNHRNTGGGNNLTGVGATLDLARTLQKLIDDERLARPLRNIHFVWGAEHMAIIYFLHEHPEATARMLALLNLDMVGDHQILSESILRLYRTPHSLPSFVNDVVQEMFEVVGAGNSISLGGGRLLDFGSSFRLPIVEPSGSRDPFYYYIEDFWGPSDHEDIAEASLGVHAVLLNTWPDPYIGTQQDTLERADATQMKRAAVIAGASAYILASAADDELPALAQNAAAKARARLAAEEGRAMDILTSSSRAGFADDSALARTILSHAYPREAAALETLSRFATTEDSRAYLDARTEEIRDELPRALARLESHRNILLRAREWADVTASPGATSTLVPVRTSLVRGPVNFFRPQYGRDWMVEKTGDPDFVRKLRLAQRGHYYLYETLNFADGTRNLLQIRDAVAAEYGPAPLDELEEYFRLLESVGVVELRQRD